MAQIKIYGLGAQLNPIKGKLSDVIHGSVVEALKFPANKRFHRFFPLEKENFYHPSDRSNAYTIIEITMISGRSVEAKKKLVSLLFETIESKLGIAKQDIEICIYESPACNWGFRGQHGDEIALNYNINV